MRTLGLKALGMVLKNQKNCDIFEKHIYNQVKSSDSLIMGSVDETYKWCIYQVVGLLRNNKDNMKSVADSVKAGKVGWKSVTYDSIAEKIEEFDEYLVKPFEVVEGISECGKCHSRKTWNVQKQQRSCDEPMTTFSRCVTCGHQWSYSG